jgi:outer membrane cobalamin receptor
MSLLFAVAQAVLATSPAPATTGVVDYPPAFFAAAHPTTARDMLDRIPGFTFDGGESVRGYEGAAGNVLIDGQRPAAKTDSLDAILRRIPTSSVAHIEIIRGGATGVDMQGRSVIANVILKRETTRKFQVSTVQTYQPSKGRITPQLRLVGSGGQADQKWEFSLFGGAYIDGTYGDGPTKVTDSRGRVLQQGYSQSHAGGQNYQMTGAYELPVAGGRLRLSGLVLKTPYDDDISNRVLSPTTSLDREHVTIDTDGSELGLRYTRTLTPTTLTLSKAPLTMWCSPKIQIGKSRSFVAC